MTHEMRLQSILFLYWSHVINFKKHYAKATLYIPLVIIWFINQNSQVLLIFQIIHIIIYSISIFIILSLIYSLIWSTLILYDYSKFDRNPNQKLLIDYIYKLDKGNDEINFGDLTKSDKVLELYLYDLEMIN